MASYAFSETVAARTRAATFIHDTPELLAQFIEHGGLARDLQTIVEAGRAAESANVGRSDPHAVGGGDLQAAFVELQREYKAVMAVARAARHDLEDAVAPLEVLEHLGQIVADETSVHVKTAKGEGDAKVRRTLKRKSQDAVRADIRRDAAALLDHTALVQALAARKVDAVRLTKLRDDADALAGRLSDRIADKAERKLATATENHAVKAQARKCEGIQRILASLDDERVRGLIKAAGRR